MVGHSQTIEIGSYEVRIRRNCSVGYNLGVTYTRVFLGVPRRRLVDLPRFWSFEDAGFPLE